MHTLEQITYNILNIYSGGRSTNNEHVSLRQIKDWIHQYRALYIRRDERRNRRLREFEQVLPDVPLELFKSSDPVLYRTPVLPEFLRLKDNEALNYAGKDNYGIDSYQVVDNHSAIWRLHSAYTKSVPIVFVQEDRVYVQNQIDAEEITLRGIFENPEEVQDYLIDNGHAQEDAPWHYPLPSDMVESIVKNILETELNFTKSTPLDITANTLPDEKLITS